MANATPQNERPSEGLSRLRELFEQALALPLEARRPWLEQLRMKDPSAAAKVEAMLTADAEDSATLDRPVIEVLANLPPTELGTAAPGATLAPGERFGPRYEILRLLGMGGMGAVYEAFDRTLGIKVALKTIRPDVSRDPLMAADFEERLKRELLLARQISHKNVIRIHDLGEVEGTRYMTMALVEGADLASILDRAGRLPVPRALHLARQIAEGLAAAHDLGVAHRDLKPANILVDVHDHAVIADFGIARSVTHTAGVPQDTDSALVGSLAYMAPEQLAGKPAGQAADIYSFGLILAEMLIGPLVPRDATARQVVFERINRPVPALRLLDASIPRALDGVVARCLRIDPQARYQDGTALASALGALNPRGRTGEDQRTRRWMAAALATVALAVSSLAMWKVVAPRSTTTAADGELVPVPITSFPQNEGDPSFSPDGSQVVFWSNLADEDNYDLFVTTIDASGPPLRLTTDPNMDRSPAWSRDGRWIVFLRGGDRGPTGQVVRVSPLGGPETVLSDSFCVPTSWSPDSQWFVCHGDRSRPPIFGLPRDGGTPRPLTQPPAGYKDSRGEISPDGSRMLFLRGKTDTFPDLYVQNLTPDGTVRGEPRLLLTIGNRCMGFSWTADGREAVISIVSTGDLLSLAPSGDLGKARLFRLSVDGGGQPRRLDVGEGALYPEVARSAERLVFAQIAYESDIWRADPNHVARHPASSTRDESSPQFHPDGHRFAFSSNRSGTFEVWVADLDGGLARQLTSIGPAGRPRWAADGSRLYFQGDDGKGRSDIYVVGAGGGPPTRLTFDPADDLNVSVSRTGEWLYFTSNRTGQFQIFRMRTDGAAVSQVTQEGGDFAMETFDGRFIVYQRPCIGATACELWRTPASGGNEERLPVSAPLGTWAVAPRGAYFVPWVTGGSANSSLSFYDFSAGTIRVVGPLEGRVEDLAVSSDGTAVLYTRIVREQSDLVMVDKFR